MLSHEPDDVLLALGQALLLLDAVGRAVAVVGRGQGGHSVVVVVVAHGVGTVGHRRQPVGVRCPGGGRLAVRRTVPAGYFRVPRLSRPVGLHVVTDYAGVAVDLSEVMTRRNGALRGQQSQRPNRRQAR